MNNDHDSNNNKLVQQAWADIALEELNWEKNVLLNNNNKLVIIGGSSLIESNKFANFKKKEQFGIRYSESEDGLIIFISRHSYNGEYMQPHMINHQKIWEAILQMQPKVVLAVCSVGSLQHNIPIGSILLPNDWLHATFTPVNFHKDMKAHVRPSLDLNQREIVLNAISNVPNLKSFLFQKEGKNDLVYCQTRGPRFETKAEIRMIKSFADVVGMTGGDEASLACELGIPYVMLCFVDNMAHGLSIQSDDAIKNIEEFRKAQKANLNLVEQVVDVAIEGILGQFNNNSNKTKLTKHIPEFPVQTLIRARYIATVNEQDSCIHNGFIVINDGVITGIYESQKNNYPQYSPQEIIDLPDSMLMPGLINAHTHAAMALMRGFGDDLKLTDWLVTKIWPAEAKCVSREYVRDGTRIAFEEMISSGTTTCLDLYFFPEEIEVVSNELGFRSVVGLVVIEFPSPMAKDGDDYLRLMKEKLEQQQKSKNSLVTYAVSPHAPYSVSEQHIIQAKEISKKHNCVFHTHLHECEEEIEASVLLNKKSGFCHRCEVACRPLANLEKNGILDSTCSFAHMTQLTLDEIHLLAKKKCHVVHCPSSNMKLACGFCPVNDLLNAGVNVAIGTDGAASNNCLDMLAEIKLAALLGKGVAKSATAVNAKQAMRMGTINGAKALGLEKNCGSIEIGKRADVIAVDLCNRNSCRPVYDPISSFVYSANRDCIRSVWIDGVAKVRNGIRVGMDNILLEQQLRSCSERWQKKMEAVVEELKEQ